MHNWKLWPVSVAINEKYSKNFLLLLYILMIQNWMQQNRKPQKFLNVQLQRKSSADTFKTGNCNNSIAKQQSAAWTPQLYSPRHYYLQLSCSCTTADGLWYKISLIPSHPSDIELMLLLKASVSEMSGTVFRLRCSKWLHNMWITAAANNFVPVTEQLVKIEYNHHHI